MRRVAALALLLCCVAVRARAQDGGAHTADSGVAEPATDEGTSFGAHAHALRPPPSHGTSDFFTQTEHLADVPHQNASTMLQSAAPGLLVTNEGGEGHAEGYVLRGFQADEGTGFEVVVDGGGHG